MLPKNFMKSGLPAPLPTTGSTVADAALETDPPDEALLVTTRAANNKSPWEQGLAQIRAGCGSRSGSP